MEEVRMKLCLSSLFQSRWNVAIFQHMPAQVSYLYMQAIGKIYYLIKRGEKRLIEANIRDMLEGKDERYIRRITKQTFNGIFAHYFEKMFSAFKDMDQIRHFVSTKFTIENEHLITEALTHEKGVILVTAHWGAVEFIPWVLGLRGHPISVIAECTTKRLENALHDKAKHINAELLCNSSDATVFFRALDSLKRNRLLMTECDEVDAWRKRDSMTIELFGKKLFFDPTLNILAKRSGAAVVGVFLQRVSRRKYTLICEPISRGGRETDSARGAFSLWQKHVSEHPDQWYQWKKWHAMKAAVAG
jgi:lauroyl/myristoyl acyltransferase